MSTEQGSQGSIDIEDANSSRLKSIANIISIDSNLTAKYKTRIRDVLGDGSNFELRLHLALQPDINIIHNMVANQMAAFWEFTAEHPHGRWVGLLQLMS